MEALACADAAPLADRLGYRFARPELLQRALTHPSFAHEQGALGASYQRLEFLGDAVLDLIAAAYLHETHPLASEGHLSTQRAALVRRESLVRMAERLALQAYVRVGQGGQEGPGGRILADSFEALVGAVFLDGGYAAAQRIFLPLLQASLRDKNLPEDYKTRLQQICHLRELPAPVYRTLAVEGPDHCRRYACAVHLGEAYRGEGQASNKRAAEQLCARSVLQQLPAAQPASKGMNR